MCNHPPEASFGGGEGSNEEEIGKTKNKEEKTNKKFYSPFPIITALQLKIAFATRIFTSPLTSFHRVFNYIHDTTPRPFKNKKK